MAMRIGPFRECAADDAVAIRRQAERDGYLFFRDLVDPVDLVALRGLVESECERRGFATHGLARPGLAPILYQDPEFVALQCVILAAPEFVAVGDAPRLLGVLTALYGGPVRTRRGDLCRIAVPGHPDRATLPHQDHFYVGGSTDIWTAWLPLTDCPLSLGPLAVRPGSHEGGVLPHDVETSGVQGVIVGPNVGWECGDFRLGDALLFSSLTVHRAAPNLSADRLRLSVDYRYEPMPG